VLPQLLHQLDRQGLRVRYTIHNHVPKQPLKHHPESDRRRRPVCNHLGQPTAEHEFSLSAHNPQHQLVHNSFPASLQWWWHHPTQMFHHMLPDIPDIRISASKTAAKTSAFKQ
jgi:hypothetical protein